jgi:HAD superfamily hydrolase (TIGR01549 family)
MKENLSAWKTEPLPSPGFLKVIAFDCDGVLLDSKNANVRFYNHILQRFGYPSMLPEQTEYAHMHSAQESLRYLLGDGPQLEAALHYCQQMDFSQFFAYSICQPGLIEFLEALKPLYKIALATNRTVSTREVLRYFHLDPYFDLVVTAADVQFPKPHPESMERILETFEASPDQALYIGDSSVDEALATAADVFFVAYQNRALKAHLHIDHFRELYPHLLPAEE